VTASSDIPPSAGLSAAEPAACFARLAAAGDWDSITTYGTALGWPQHPAPGRTLHPVLVEITRTHLVWVEAESQQAARLEAEKNPQVRAAAPDAAVPVDVSVQVAELSEPAAAWLDADPETYQRLDAYFAAARAGG
jgi:hypothetical protein